MLLFLYVSHASLPCFQGNGEVTPTNTHGQFTVNLQDQESLSVPAFRLPEISRKNAGSGNAGEAFSAPFRSSDSDTFECARRFWRRIDHSVSTPVNHLLSLRGKCLDGSLLTIALQPIIFQIPRL